MQRKRSIRPVSSKKKAFPAETRIIRRVLSMESTAAFKSQLETEYRQGNLSKTVLARLFKEVNVGRFALAKKRAMLKALTDYRSKV